MIQDSDLLYLRAAVALAERGLFTCTPNPRVGCLIVRGGRVLGRGAHLWTGQAHAEINALADARGDAAGATVYVSLEPCAHHGRTPPCADALIRANVRRVVAAMRDPFSRVAGQGFARLREAGIVTEVRELPEAHALNAGYRSRIRNGRPWVRIKVAASLDGRTAMASGESRWITSPEARADVQYWRARSCAVVTGSGTVLADDPSLNVRDARYAQGGTLRQPLRVVVDSALRVPADAALLKAPGPILFAHAHAHENSHAHEHAHAREHSHAREHAHDAAPLRPAPPTVEHLACGDERVDLSELLRALAERGCNEVLVEAGPRLVGAFLESGLWDELLVYLAPRLLGSDARPLAQLPLRAMTEALDVTLVDCTQIGPDLRLRYRPT
jgi:diaminohydroxyphosphoribosylaminopyrimidine deaminase/5-amino-6-(5-phosphoribosylamino)uracil reductase